MARNWWFLLCACILMRATGLQLRSRLSVTKEHIIQSAKKAMIKVPVSLGLLLSGKSLLPIAPRGGQEALEKLSTPIAQQRTANTPTPNKQNQLQFLFVRNAAQHVGPSVVRIDCDREISPMLSMFSDGFREGDIMKVSGTGIITSTDGYIITNAHVVEQAKRVTVTLSNGRTFKATVIGSDEFTDLAIIKIDPSGLNGCSLTPAPIGDSSALHAGDWVIAVGCPVGLDFTVTLGVVSSPKRSAAEVGAPHLKGTYIQTDAALNSGNSGGPLVNDVGEVVGINTMVRTNTEAIGFAIPINRVVQICDVLKTGRKPAHAFFGMKVMSITPDMARIHNEDPNSQRLFETHGALVVRVVPGSPADKCGLRRQDILVSVDGQKVKSADDAEDLLDRATPGGTCQLVVLRGENGKRVELAAVPQDLHVMLEEQRKQQQLAPPPVVVLKPRF